MDILNDLQRGINKWHTDQGVVVALITTDGVGGRYTAVVFTPKYTTQLGDVNGMQDSEGILTFYKRIAPSLEKIVNEFGVRS